MKRNWPATYVDAFTTYEAYLKVFIAEARLRGAIPVLCTPVNRRTFNAQGKITNSLGNYPAAVRQVAAEEKVPLIDLNAMTKRLYEAMVRPSRRRPSSTGPIPTTTAATKWPSASPRASGSRACRSPRSSRGTLRDSIPTIRIRSTASTCRRAPDGARSSRSGTDRPHEDGDPLDTLRGGARIGPGPGHAGPGRAQAPSGPAQPRASDALHRRRLDRGGQRIPDGRRVGDTVRNLLGRLEDQRREPRPGRPQQPDLRHRGALGQGPVRDEARRHVLLQFGHNDAGAINDSSRARG